MSTSSDVSNDQPLANKVALITGGGSGIGRGIAEAFVAAGASVAITGRREGKIAEVAKQLADSGGRALAIAGDVSRRDEAQHMVEETVKHLGALHIVVNNAGIAKFGTLDDTSDEDLDAMIDIDLKGPLYMCKAALPFLREFKGDTGASILNISTCATLLAVKSFPVYSAAKAGLNQLTKCLAIDLGPEQIRVNAILPGVVETDIFNADMPKDAVEKAYADFAPKHPLGRIGYPRDIAPLAVFLSSPAASWITGSLIPVDGGIGLG